MPILCSRNLSRVTTNLGLSEVLPSGVNLVLGPVSGIELMEHESVREELAELYSPDGVPAAVEAGRVNAHSQNIGDHDNEGS